MAADSMEAGGVSEQAVAAVPASGPKKRERASATFRADHLHALEPLIRLSQDSDHFRIAGLIIEPVEAGGAVLVATEGHVLAAIYDPEARVSRPMRLTIPDSIFAAVTPPKPVSMWSEGETFGIPLPEWAMPKTVWAWSLSINVLPAMHLPGEPPEYSPMLASELAEEGHVYAGGYRLHPEAPTIQWRKVLDRDLSVGCNSFRLNPFTAAQFERIGGLYRNALRLTLGQPGEAAILTSEDGTFVGATMPVKDLGEAPIPAWARPTVAQAPESAQ